MEKFLIKLLKNKNFDFKVDTDKDGIALAEGKINLGELLDEVLKIVKK